jgi:hypothetical protein
MRSQTSALDDAIRALVQVLRAALPEGTQILDGPATERPEKDTIVIGAAGDGTAALIQRGEPDYGGRVTETGDIVCVISCWDGDTDVAAKRARVFGYLAAIDAELRQNPTLVCQEFPDGAVDDSALGDTGELVQRQQSGALAALGFSIRYEAHI